MKPQLAWAVIWPRTPDEIDLNSIGETRNIPLEEIGEIYAEKGETPQQGWRRAYRRGLRIVRVRVCLDEDVE